MFCPGRLRGRPPLATTRRTAEIARRRGPRGGRSRPLDVVVVERLGQCRVVRGALVVRPGEPAVDAALPALLLQRPPGGPGGEHALVLPPHVGLAYHEHCGAAVSYTHLRAHETDSYL